MMREKTNYREEEDHLDPITTTTTTNRLATLCLTGTTTTSGGVSDHHHHHQPTHQVAPVIFSDPCNLCGTMNRRTSYSSPPPQLQESSSAIFFQPPPPPPSPPRNHNNDNKKMKIISEGECINNPFPILGRSDHYSFIPSTVSSAPPPARIPQSDPSLLCSNISNHPITPFPVISPPSSLPATNPVSFSTPSMSPETATGILKQTTTATSTPPPSNKKYKQFHSFPVDAQQHQYSSSSSSAAADEEGSPAPATPSLPPRLPRSLHCSFSDPSSSLPIITPTKTTTTTTLNGDNPMTTTSSDCQIGGGSKATGDSGPNAAELYESSETLDEGNDEGTTIVVIFSVDAIILAADGRSIDADTKDVTSNEREKVRPIEQTMLCALGGSSKYAGQVCSHIREQVLYEEIIEFVENKVFVRREITVPKLAESGYNFSLSLGIPEDKKFQVFIAGFDDTDEGEQSHFVGWIHKNGFKVYTADKKYMFCAAQDATPKLNDFLSKTVRDTITTNDAATVARLAIALASAHDPNTGGLIRVVILERSFGQKTLVKFQVRQPADEVLEVMTMMMMMMSDDEEEEEESDDE